jgi:hypothetical protein
VQSVLPPALDAEDAAAMLQVHLPGTAKALKSTEGGGGGGGGAVAGVVVLETVTSPHVHTSLEPVSQSNHSLLKRCPSE